MLTSDKKSKNLSLNLQLQSYIKIVLKHCKPIFLFIPFLVLGSNLKAPHCEIFEKNTGSVVQQNHCLWFDILQVLGKFYKCSSIYYYNTFKI